jgi:hypothetical protein
MASLPFETQADLMLLGNKSMVKIRAEGPEKCTEPDKDRP